MLKWVPSGTERSIRYELKHNAFRASITVDRNERNEYYLNCHQFGINEVRVFGKTMDLVFEDAEQLLQQRITEFDKIVSDAKAIFENKTKEDVK